MNRNERVTSPSFVVDVVAHSKEEKTDKRSFERIISWREIN